MKHLCGTNAAENSSFLLHIYLVSTGWGTLPGWEPTKKDGPPQW